MSQHQPFPVDIDPLDPPHIVAAGLGVSTQTLANWRCSRRVDLPYIKIGRLVRYPRSGWRAMVSNAPSSQREREAA